MSRAVASKNMGIYYPYNIVSKGTSFEIQFNESLRRYEVTVRTQTYNNIAPSPAMPQNVRCRVSWESNVDAVFRTLDFEYESQSRVGNKMEVVGFFKNSEQIINSIKWYVGTWITRMKIEIL